MPENSDSSPEKSKVLDLLDTTKKPSRRERQRKDAEVVPPAPSVLDEQKANALDLFADEKKPKVRKTTRTGKAVIGTISKLLDKEDDLNAKVAESEAPRRCPLRHHQPPPPPVMPKKKFPMIRN